MFLFCWGKLEKKVFINENAIIRGLVKASRRQTYRGGSQAWRLTEVIPGKSRLLSTLLTGDTTTCLLEKDRESEEATQWSMLSGSDRDVWGCSLPESITVAWCGGSTPCDTLSPAQCKWSQKKEFNLTNVIELQRRIRGGNKYCGQDTALTLNLGK